MIHDKQYQFPLSTVISLLGLAAISLIAVVLIAKDTYEVISTTIDQTEKIVTAHNNILLYDEMLTMSASMAATTGDSSWIDRYKRVEPLLNEAIENAVNYASNDAIRFLIGSTDKANSVLVDMERASFEHVRNGDLESAWKILSSDEYKHQKEIYAKGIGKAIKAIKAETLDNMASIKNRLIFNLAGSVFAFFIILFIWLIVLKMLKKWRNLQFEHQKELKELATHDVLTGLPNRSLLADRLTQATAQESRRNSALAVVFIDLDGFKPINDQYGHNAGDTLLKALAKRLQEVVREGDTVSRFGGDEFVIILVDIESQSILLNLLNRIKTVLHSPVKIESENIQVTASLGVSIFDKNHNVEPEQLIRQADHAMYDAKKAGKNQYVIYNHEQVKI